MYQLNTSISGLGSQIQLNHQINTGQFGSLNVTLFMFHEQYDVVVCCIQLIYMFACDHDLVIAMWDQVLSVNQLVVVMESYVDHPQDELFQYHHHNATFHVVCVRLTKNHLVQAQLHGTHFDISLFSVLKSFGYTHISIVKFVHSRLKSVVFGPINILFVQSKEQLDDQNFVIEVLNQALQVLVRLKLLLELSLDIQSQWNRKVE